MKVNANPFRPFVAGVILMLLILIFEITIKILVGTVGYLLVALFTIWFVHTHGLIILTGFISSLFSLAVLFMPFSDSVPYVTIIVNRIIAIAVIWLAVLFTFRFRKLYHTEHREKQQLKALVEHANEGILLVNREGRIFVANPSAEKIFGYPRGELSGKVINDLIPQRYWKDHTQHFERFTEEPSSRAMGRNLSGIRKDGSEFHVDISLSHFYEGSELTFIAFVLDATDRIRHEELASLNMKIVSSHNQELERKVKQRTLELETTNQELMKSQALYHSMAHNFPDGFIGVMNRNLKYMLVDGKGLPELGLNAKSVLDDRVFDNIHETMTLYAEGAIRKVFDGENVSFDVELNGKYYNVTAVPIGGIDSLINEILVVVKNISGQKTLERELVKTLEKEKELNTLKSRFVTMASHEFRTPLTTILSSAFLLENYTGRQLESEKKKHLERIKRSVHGLTELLNDFLSLGKLEEGIVQVVFKPINLRVLGEELLQEVSLIKKEDQKVVFEFNGDEAEILIDKHLVRNILLNLLSNAIKYSPVSSTITLTISVTFKNVKLKVSDQGIGIPTDEQKFIFKRFFRANNTSDIQGTGLGLNIVRRYVKLLNGQIKFHSQVNKGTVFIVTLPLEYATELNLNT